MLFSHIISFVPRKSYCHELKIQSLRSINTVKEIHDMKGNFIEETNRTRPIQAN